MNFSSIAARGNAGQAAYSAAKSGVADALGGSAALFLQEVADQHLALYHALAERGGVGFEGGPWGGREWRWRQREAGR